MASDEGTNGTEGFALMKETLFKVEERKKNKTRKLRRLYKGRDEGEVRPWLWLRLF